MDDFIPISQLNDFVFCPYSIYLHNVYMGGDETLYHAAPQTQGNASHEAIDNKTSNHRKNTILSLPVGSHRLRVVGKIDTYKKEEHLLVVRKHNLKHIFRGQLYQLWTQYFCMIEMGYPVERLAFYEISTRTTIPISLPTEEEEQELMATLEAFRKFNIEGTFDINSSKCQHCIYSNLCDKTNSENVYT